MSVAAEAPGGGGGAVKWNERAANCTFHKLFRERSVRLTLSAGASTS